MNPQQNDEVAEKKLEQDIKDMFDFEAQRNDLNFALSGEERGEMTIEDYKKDLSLAISRYVYRDLLPPTVESAVAESQIEVLKDLPQYKDECKQVKSAQSGNSVSLPITRRIFELEARRAALRGKQ